MYFTTLIHYSSFCMVLLDDDPAAIDPLKVCFYLGICLLLACVIMLLSPLRDKISGATQKIQGFGLNLEVSVLTLLFLISAALISTGIWVKLGSVKDQLVQARLDKERADAAVLTLRDEIEKAKINNVEAWVTLDGVDDVSKLTYTALECTYQTSADVVQQCRISKGDFLNRIRVTFDINKGTKIKGLVIKEINKNGNSREWRDLNEFDPFKQSRRLSMEKSA